MGSRAKGSHGRAHPGDQQIGRTGGAFGHADSRRRNLQLRREETIYLKNQQIERTQRRVAKEEQGR